MKREVLITVAIGDHASGETLGAAYSLVQLPDDLMTRFDPDRQQDWFLETVKVCATNAYREAFTPRMIIMQMGPDGKPTVDEIRMMDEHVADVERRRAEGEAP